MTTPKPKLDLFNESPCLVSKKCRTSTPSLRPPKPPTKSSQRVRLQRGYLEHRQSFYQNNYPYPPASQHHQPTPPNHFHHPYHHSPFNTTPSTIYSGTSSHHHHHNNNNNINNNNINQCNNNHHHHPNNDSSCNHDHHHYHQQQYHLCSFPEDPIPHDGSFSAQFPVQSNNNSLSVQNVDEYTRMYQQFEVISKIGSGHFADVYKVKSLGDGQYYAIKKTTIPFTSKSDRLRKLQEVKNHQSLPPHPNCVRYYDSWEEDGFLYIQTELCKTSLNEILETSDEHKLPEQVVWGYLMDLLQAVKHLHDHDLLHLDIKPDNILIANDGTAKLGDFGLMCNCQDLNSSMSSTSPTTPPTTAATSPTPAESKAAAELPATINGTSTPSSSPEPSVLSATTITSTTTSDTLPTIHDGDTSTIGTNTTALAADLIDDSMNVDDDFMMNDTFGGSSLNHQPLDHDDSGIINRSDDSIDSIDEGDSKYLASETMQGKFTKAADIFSLGITIFEVASGLDLPQRGKIYHKLRHNEIEDLYFNGLSADLVRVIKMMMEEDYLKRPTVDDLLQLEALRARRRYGINST